MASTRITDTATAKAMGKRSGTVRRARTQPDALLRERWPTPPDIMEFATSLDGLNLTFSPAQETLLRAIYGMDLDDAQLALWRDCTGRESYPGVPFPEVTVIAGARSGKDSRIVAPMVIYEAIFGRHDAELGRGEHPMVPLVAQDWHGAHVALNYIRAGFQGSKVLRGLLAEGDLRSELRLWNHWTIRCFPCTRRSTRGWSIPVGVMDETAFYRLEGQADADVEIQASMRRGMIAFPTARLVKVSTPYLATGILHDDFSRYWGQDGVDVLVWRAPTALMNPSVTAQRLEREQRLDPSRFAREYLAEFATDLEAFLPMEWVERAITAGVSQRPPEDGVTYRAAIDPSGGGADAFTFTIMHRDGPRVVQDLLKGWRRRGGQALDLEGVVAEIVQDCRRYRCFRVTGDKYAGSWVSQAFERQHFTFEPATLTKSGAYIEVQPLFAEGRLDLLDNKTMAREFMTLERRPRQGGVDSVDHPKGLHDDHANVTALGAAIAVVNRRAYVGTWEI